MDEINFLSDNINTVQTILPAILPAIITGMLSFLGLKYTYNRNIPLEKLEIAYNRVYYPIYTIISEKNESIDGVIDKINIYFLKYNKYIDISTKKIFESLCECKKETKKKAIYQKFKNNIFNKSSYLRRKLGYLEPSFLELYKYSMPATRSLIRIMLEISMIYLAVIFCIITAFIENDIYFAVSLSIFLCFVFMIVAEVIWRFLRFLYDRVIKWL